MTVRRLSKRFYLWQK